jgi:hypothetical protein
MSTIESTFDKIKFWAEERNLIKGSNSLAQFAKLISEFGELCDHIYELADDITNSSLPLDASHYTNKIKDDIGDCSVVLRIIAEQNNIAFNDIIYIDSLPGNPALYDGHILSIGICFGNLGDAILKNDMDIIYTSIGLSLGYLQMLAQQYELDYIDCVKYAYNEIKDRKGVMYNGAFIKSNDARYPKIMKELGLIL